MSVLPCIHRSPRGRPRCGPHQSKVRDRRKLLFRTALPAAGWLDRDAGVTLEVLTHELRCPRDASCRHWNLPSDVSHTTHRPGATGYERHAVHANCSSRVRVVFAPAFIGPMLNASLAALLVLAAVGLLLYLGSLLFNAASIPLGGWLERRRFGRYVARAQQFDTALREGRPDDALRALRRAFYLHTVSTPSLAMSVANHHTGLLSRLIALTADRQHGTVRLLSLAKVDRLLTERSALQRHYLAARQSRRPSRVRELHRQLRANSRDLAVALEHLIAEARAAEHPVRYH